MPSSMIHAVFMVAITAEKINIKCISLQYRLLRIPHESSLKALYFLDIACKVLSLIGVESRTYYIRRSRRQWIRLLLVEGSIVTICLTSV